MDRHSEPVGISRFENLSFRSFEGWTQTSDFRRMTLLFGRNGSGKSTLASAIKPSSSGNEDLEEPPTGQLLLTNGLRVDLPNMDSIKVLVFDAEYAHRAVRLFESGHAEPVWAFGDSSRDLVERLLESRTEESRLAADLESCEGMAKRAELEVTRVEGEIRDAVRRLGDLRVFTGQRDFTHVQAKTALASLSGDGIETDLLSPGQAEEILAVISAMNSGNLPEAVPHVPELATLADTLATPPQPLPPEAEGEGTATLPQSPEVVAWIQQGTRLHEPDHPCLFCLNQYSEPRARQLANAFSQDFEDAQLYFRKCATLARQSSDGIRSLTDRLARTQSGLFASVDVPAALADASQRSGMLDAAAARFATYAEDPRLSWKTGEWDWIPADDGLEGVREAQRAMSRDLAATISKNVETYLRHVKALTAQNHQTAKADHSRAAAEAASANISWLKAKRLVESLAVEQISQSRDGKHNATLLSEDIRNYLGRSEYTIEFVDGGDTQIAGYRLLRAGAKASALSEGERTALALVYFLRTLDGVSGEDQDVDSQRRRLSSTIVWIDDPVSSMDAGAMSVAAAFIRHRLFNRDSTMRVAQLLVSTHDARFLTSMHESLPSFLVDGHEGPGATEDSDSTVLSVDPFASRVLPLPNHHVTRAHVRLFREVMDALLSGDSDRQMWTQNLARQLLELQGHWLHPTRTLSDAVRQIGDDLGYPPERLDPLLKCLHLGSHADDGFHAEGDPAALPPGRVLTDALDRMRRSDERHFEALMMATRVDRPSVLALLGDAERATFELALTAFLVDQGSPPMSVKCDSTSFGAFVVDGWRRPPVWERDGLNPSAVRALQSRGWSLDLEGRTLRGIRASGSSLW